jgi:ornithine decarboxylase
MPRVKPHFAVKCFPDVGVLATLANLGAGFDCASAREVQQVLGLGVEVQRIIFANPCKRSVDMATIAEHHVRHTTFDSPFELEKLAARCPGVGCVLRIRADDPTARMPFGTKYGAAANEYLPLLKHAHTLGLRVTGVSFHVGSGAGSPAAYKHALAAARLVWDLYSRQVEPAALVQSWLVDIGGGLTGGFDEQTGDAFVQVGDSAPDAVAWAVNDALDELFPETDFPGGLSCISEPGRYLAECSSHIVTRVIGKRERLPINIQAPELAAAATEPVDGNSSCEEVEEKKNSGSSDEESEEKNVDSGGEVHYYISDGLYGGFNAIVYDGWLPKAIPFRVNFATGCAAVITESGPINAPATIFGPTCDSLDMVFCKLDHCPNLQVGDWLLFPACGAYTQAGATDFNGIPSTFGGGVRNFYVRAADHAVSQIDLALPVLFNPVGPVSVKKNFA